MRIIMMETTIYIFLVATMAIGAYALYDAIMHERAVHAEQAKQRMYCELVKTSMLAEFNAIVGSGKFLTEQQQECWMYLMQSCADGGQ